MAKFGETCGWCSGVVLRHRALHSETSTTSARGTSSTLDSVIIDPAVSLQSHSAMTRTFADGGSRFRAPPFETTTVVRDQGRVEEEFVHLSLLRPPRAGMDSGSSDSKDARLTRTCFSSARGPGGMRA